MGVPPRILGFLGAAGALIVAAPAHAAPGPEPVRLSWVRGRDAETCSSQPRVAAKIAARLGRDPFARDAARSVDAIVARTPNGWRAEIWVRGADGALVGSRELTSEADSCAGIEDAAVLAIALAIDPDVLVAPPPPSSPPPAPAPHAFAPPRSPSRPPVPAVPTPAVPRIVPLRLAPREVPVPIREPRGLGPGPTTVALRAGAGLGLLPHVGAAFSLAGHVGIGATAQIAAEAMWLPEVHAGDPRFSFGLSAFALGACGSLVREGRVDFGLCGQLWAGALHAVVYGLEPLEPGEHPWAAAELSPLLRVRLASHLHAELGVRLLVPLVRQAFLVKGFADPVFQEPVVAGAPFLGLGAHFP